MAMSQIAHYVFAKIKMYKFLIAGVLQILENLAKSLIFSKFLEDQKNIQ